MHLQGPKQEEEKQEDEEEACSVSDAKKQKQEKEAGPPTFLNFADPAMSPKVVLKLGKDNPIVGFTLPRGAVQANDGSSPYLGVVDISNPGALFNKDGWYRATMTRSTGFVWEAKYLPTGADCYHGGEYVMVLVAAGGKISSPLASIPFSLDPEP